MAKAKATVRYRPIKDFAGYRVGSDGSVWSCLAVHYPEGGTRSDRSYKPSRNWRPMSVVDKGDGHMIVRLQGGFMRRVARLVLAAFVGPCPVGMEACHNDGNPRNNRIKNLRWDTHLNNILDKHQHGTTLRGEAVASAKLRRGKVLAIRRDLAEARAAAKAEGYKKLPQGHLAKISAKHGVTCIHAARLARKERWSWLP